MLTDKGHDLTAVHAGNVHPLCSPHRIAAARADVLPAVGLGGAFDDGGVVVSGKARNSEEEKFVAGDRDGVQVVLFDEVKQLLSGGGNRPSVFGVTLHDESVCLCCFLIAAIMVHGSSADILDAVDVAVVVGEFVHQDAYGLVYRSTKGSRPDVQLMGNTNGGNPRVLAGGEVSQSLGGTLDGDGGTFQLIVKEAGVQQVKEDVQVLDSLNVGGDFLHNFSLLYS